MELLENVLTLLKKLEPLFALLIIVLLIVVAIYLPQQIRINEQIRNSCGWENEQVRCICEKKIFEGYKINLSGVNNVPLVR